MVTERFYIVTDLDGTLWTDDMVIPDRHLRALAQLEEMGGVWVVATARGPASAHANLARNTCTPMFVICLDGCIVEIGDGRRLIDRPIDPHKVLTAHKILQRHGLEACFGVYGSSADQLIGGSPSTCREHLAYLRNRSAVACLNHEIRKANVYNINIRGRQKRILSSAANTLAELDGCEIMFEPDHTYGDWYLSIRPANTTKWTGIESLRVTTERSRLRIVAVGDGSNDIDLLSHADLAIAIEGAHEALRSVADTVVPTPEEEGFALVPRLILEFLCGSKGVVNERMFGDELRICEAG